MTPITAVLFGPFDGRLAVWRRPSPRAWTCLGALAIPLWATWPALALRTLEMPAFECLTIAFLFGWLVLRSAERKEQGGATLARSWRSLIPATACAIGLSGSNAFHILATHYIPAAEANLISYLWPVMIVALGAALGLFRLRPRHVAGLIAGFTGAIVLLGSGALSLSLVGIGLAFMSGLSWALYCIFRLKWPIAAGSVLTRGCAISAMLCATAHVLLEPTVVPSVGGAAAAAAVGVVPLAFGNLMWDEGFRRGDSQLLAIMACATPLCSAFLLAALGFEAFTWNLAIGAAVIVVAGLLSRADA